MCEDVELGGCNETNISVWGMRCSPWNSFPIRAGQVWLWGRTLPGRVIGTVYDPQGCVGARGQGDAVVGTWPRRSTMQPFRSELALFQVLNLPIGTYRVEVEHQGFAKAVTQEKQLQINQSLAFNITLALWERAMIKMSP